MASLIYDTIEPTGSEYYPEHWDRSTVADGKWLQKNTLQPLRDTDLFLASAIDMVMDDIDTMKAATDVIMVYGTYEAFESNSGDLVSTSALTDMDVVKVLQDEEISSCQVYYQWHDWDGSDYSWSAIGTLDPYYNTTYIDEMSANLEAEIIAGTTECKEYTDNRITNISATVANNYISGNSGALHEGDNIVITFSGGNSATISTDSNVVFNNISASGHSAKADVSALIISAEAGSAASSFIDNNITAYVTGVSIDDSQGINIGSDVNATHDSSGTYIKIQLSGYKSYPTTSNIFSATESNNGYNIQFGLTTGAEQAIQSVSSKLDGSAITGEHYISAVKDTANNRWKVGMTDTAESTLQSVSGKLAGSAITGENYISAAKDTANNRWKVGLTDTAGSTLQSVSGKLAGSAITADGKFLTAGWDGTNKRWNISGTSTLDNVSASAQAASAWISNTGNYVRHNEHTLKIGNSNLTANTYATAFGNNVSADTNYSFAAGHNLTAYKSVALGNNVYARSQSFAVSFGDLPSATTSAIAKGYAIGELNSAYYNSYIIGYSNTGASGSFMVGIGNSGISNIIVGTNNKNTSGGMIFGSHNNADLSATPNMILLGNVCRGTYTNGDLLAVGWGDENSARDGLKLSQTALDLFPEYEYYMDVSYLTKGTSITPFHLKFNNTSKIYTCNDISAISVSSTWPATASKLGELNFNTLMLNANASTKRYFNAYIPRPASYGESTGYCSNSFRIMLNGTSASYRFGLPDEWTVILKGFYGNITAAGKDNLRYTTGTNLTGSWSDHETNPHTDSGTYITVGDYVKPAGDAPQFWYLWIDTMFGGQYLDCIIDRNTKHFVLMKGAYGGINS